MFLHFFVLLSLFVSTTYSTYNPATEAYIPTLSGPEEQIGEFAEDYDYSPTAAQRLMRHLLKRRGPDIVKPKRNGSEPVMIKFKMELYQVIELNERQQYVSVSAWVIERWYDDFFYWNPSDFDNVTEVKVHHSLIWIPDTTLYNTLVMKDDDQRRLLYVKITTDHANRRAYVEFLYPAIYKFYCRLYLQFFPFDSQTCHMIFGSWTSDNKDIDYYSLAGEVGTANYMPNEGWSLMGTAGVEAAPPVGTDSYVPNEEWSLLGTLAVRKEVKYVCCPNNYTLLDFTLFLRRRPLFYLVNLVIPTFIITLIAITGFFTTSSTTGVREEKISLCITTLLSMSILMLMVSDQMPSTSTFIPLISWFYMCAIIIISVGALAASFVISVQKFGRLGERLPKKAVALTRFFSSLSLTRIPNHLQPKDKLLEKLKNMSKTSDRSTIAQFARYMFTAGTEVCSPIIAPALRDKIPAYPHFSQYGSIAMTPIQTLSLSSSRRNSDDIFTVQAYPTIASNGCFGNGVEPLLNVNGDLGQKQDSPRTRRREQLRRHQSSCSEVWENADSDRLSSRQLAKLEYDWLATVIERCTFLVFLLCFLCVSLGINFVGVVHWLNSQPPPYATPAHKQF